MLLGAAINDNLLCVFQTNVHENGREATAITMCIYILTYCDEYINTNISPFLYVYIFKCMYIYIYISGGPFRGHQAAKGNTCLTRPSIV